MKRKKLFFFLSLIGILVLLLISTTIKPPTITGKIKTITYGNNKITLQIENNNIGIIIFTNKILALTTNQTIQATGKIEQYKNQTQFIADKIILK